jgi:multidrug efflux pump subunit AcrA (membrane-fusion protein)
MKSKTAFIGILSILLISGCQPKVEKKEVRETIPVKVTRVELRELNEVLEYVGNIKAQDEVVVYPKVSGKIIEKVKVDGEQVNKGEAIAYIDRDEVGLKFEKAPVENPLTGVLGKFYVDIGANVLVSTPVALVINMDTVKISLDIPEKYLPKIYLGQSANIQVDAYPEEVFKGEVTKISPVVNLENRAAPIETKINNQDHRLKSGMFASASLIIEKHPSAVVILKEAILGKEPDTYVYLIENNKAVMRKITLGIHSGPYYEVLEGIKEGDLVVIVGQQRLYDNAPVAVEIGNGNTDNTQP